MKLPISPYPASLHDLIHTNARKNPHAHALLAPERQPLTYRELADQMDYVHQVLRTRGIGGSNRVAVVLPDGPEMATAMLAIAAHAACAPLNPSYRDDDFDFYLRDLRAKAIVVPAGTDLPARTVATRIGLTVLELEPFPTGHAGSFTLDGVSAAGAPPSDVASEEDIALVLHTSGTTSRSKQVPLSHANLVTSARNIAAVLKLASDDCCLNIMPLFHIHGFVGALLSSMLAGGSVVCTRGFDNYVFTEAMRAFQPTWYSAVPTLHQSVVALARANPAVAAGGHLRLIRSSSSSLPHAVMAELEATFRVPVIESYGMTEAAHQMASNPLPPAERKPGSVGLPAGPEMAVMDDEGRLLPAGEVGEIVIRGPNVTAGYVNNAEANQAAFTDGWFRSGDLGRTDRDGYFYIAGRRKEMINRGGEKISPREIDEVLLEHPAVAQAIAFAVPHPSLGEDVAAAVVMRAEADITEQDLRDFAFTRLPEFKVPARVVFIDAIPKGPTGKPQRIGLHKQFAPLLRTEHVAPDGPVETKLAAMWMELLNLPRVGRNDNFFACGGDSLQAARLAARVRADWGVELSLPALFRQPTLWAQAAAVGEGLPSASQAARQEMAALLEHLEGLSDEEANRLLAKELQDPATEAVTNDLPDQEFG
jgi:oxalate---CoA ligase